jgi:crossover junction endodeoxyribonuclease RusA
VTSVDAMRARLFVPELGLGWISSNQRVHRMELARRSRAWRDTTANLAHMAGLPHFDRAHVQGQLFFKIRRRRDPNNWAPTAKPCIDGLVDAGVFDDDDHTRVIGPDMRFGGHVDALGNVGLLLIITELPAELS